MRHASLHVRHSAAACGCHGLERPPLDLNRINPLTPASRDASWLHHQHLSSNLGFSLRRCTAPYLAGRTQLCAHPSIPATVRKKRHHRSPLRRSTRRMQRCRRRFGKSPGWELCAISSRLHQASRREDPRRSSKHTTTLGLQKQPGCGLPWHPHRRRPSCRSSPLQRCQDSRTFMNRGTSKCLLMKQYKSGAGRAPSLIGAENFCNR